VVLSNCTKKEDIATKDTMVIETGNYQYNVPETQVANKILYVNSIEGLRVRNAPSTSGERIAILDNLTEVLVIREDGNEIIIDGINGKWTLIKYENIEGWVFGGFLTAKPQIIPESSLNNISSILEYIFDNINIKAKYNSFDEVIKNADFNIIGEWSFLDPRGLSPEERENAPDNTNVDTVEYEKYLIITFHSSIENPEREYYSISFDIKLDESPYLALFPYRNINDPFFREDERFRRQGKWDPLDLSYFVGYADDKDEYLLYIFGLEAVFLSFRNGILRSLRWDFTVS
jgi:hypothetical protein